MEKFQPDPNDSDILKERYKGTSSGVAIAGYAYLSHLGSMIAGLIVGGVAAYFAHRQVNGAVDKIRSWSKSDKGFLNVLNRSIFGHTHPTELDALKNLKVDGISSTVTQKLDELIQRDKGGFFQNRAAGFVKFVSKKEKVATFFDNLQPEKLSAGFMGGGFGVVFGWVASTAWAFFKGGHEGSAGKKQFKRAQAEIEELRDMNDDLNQINDELHAKYREASTQFRNEAVETGKLRVSADDVTAARHETAASDATKPPTTLKSESASHQGMLAAAPELAATPA